MLQYNFHVQNISMKVEFQIKALRSASCEGSNNVYNYSNFWSESINSTARNILGICNLLIRHSPISSQFFNFPDSLLIEPRRDPNFGHLWGISFTKPFIISCDLRPKLYSASKRIYNLLGANDLSLKELVSKWVWRISPPSASLGQKSQNGSRKEEM